MSQIRVVVLLVNALVFACLVVYAATVTLNYNRGTPLDTELRPHLSSWSSSSSPPNNVDFPSFLQDYSAWHADQLRNNPANARYLVFNCHGGCGGIGDRFRAILPLLYASIATKRVFLIDYTIPTPLTDVLLPNKIDWSSLSSIPNYSNLKVSKVIDQKYSDGWYHHMDTVANGAGPQYLKVAANGHPIYPYVEGFQNITGYSMIPTVFHRYAWEFLFTPTEQLVSRVAQLQLSAGVYGKHYAALHMRMGSVKGDIQWKDPVRHQLDQVNTFYNLSKTIQLPGETVIVLSDSEVAKKTITQLDASFVYLNTSILHVDRPSVNAPSFSKVSGHIDTFAEILVLAGSRCFVGCKSRFSYFAWKISAPLDGTKRCYVSFNSTKP